MSATTHNYRFAFPEAVRAVLAERVKKLRSGRFPETNIAYAGTLAQLLEDILQRDLDDPYPHRLAADLAIVASRVAHAQDRDSTSDEFVFQPEFRDRVWLAEQCNFRSGILDPDSVEKLMTAVQAVNPRVLTMQEKELYIEWHKNARNPSPPLLVGEKMAAFLDSQKVYLLPGGTGKLRLCGLSSFDGTCIYVVDEDDGSTIPHELEHNLRRYIEEDVLEQLYHPRKIPLYESLILRGIPCSAKRALSWKRRTGGKCPMI